MAEALNTSELGTRSYWDAAYSRELKNHADDADDEGTIWFDDTGAEDKVIELLDELAEAGALTKTSPDATSVLDLGTGNGHMLFSLREEDWTGPLVGVDYSDTSVMLAKQIARSREESDPEGCGDAPRFETWDLLHEPVGSWLETGFDVVLDKGTFDAISLASEADTRGRRLHEIYRERVLPLVRSDGLFIITSCNWTRDEVISWFVTGDGKLQLFREVKYPSFTFGGQQGQSVCTLAFRKSG